MTEPFEQPPAIRQMYAEMMDFRRQAMEAISHMMKQINRQNTLIFSLMQDLDLVEEITCPACDDGDLILRPKLKNLPTEGNTCPACGYDFDTGQPTIEDFGSYVGQDQEE